MRKCKARGSAKGATSESQGSAEGAENESQGAAPARKMKARGKREAQRNASPLVTRNNFEQSTESAKYKCQLFRSYRASRPSRSYDQGRRASRCSALAPGFHIPRLRRCPGFHIPRLRRCPWLSYSAPSALSLAFIFRAFGAASPYIFRAFGAGRS